MKAKVNHVWEPLSKVFFFEAGFSTFWDAECGCAPSCSSHIYRGQSCPHIYHHVYLGTSMCVVFAHLPTGPITGVRSRHPEHPGTLPFWTLVLERMKKLSCNESLREMHPSISPVISDICLT